MKISVKIFILSLIFLVSCKSVVKLNSDTVENKDIELLDFNSIRVESSLEVTLYKAKENRIKISSDAMEYIDAGVDENGTLVIKLNTPERYKYSGNKTSISVWAKDVRHFEANSNAEIEVKGNFIANEQTIVCSSSGEIDYDAKCNILNIEANSSAEFEGKLNIKELYATALSSADIDIKGSANKAVLKASSSADIDALKLNADYVEVDASSSADISIAVNKEIKGEVSSGADLKYKAKGNIKVNVDQNSGGEIEGIN